MKAKATTSYPIMAFGGVEFVKYEWRAVPAGFEDAAMAHPNLEVQQPEPEPEPVKEPEPEPKPKPTRRRTTRSKSK